MSGLTGRGHGALRCPAPDPDARRPARDRLVGLGIVLATAGVILDTVSRSRREMKRIMYLAQPYGLPRPCSSNGHRARRGGRRAPAARRRDRMSATAAVDAADAANPGGGREASSGEHAHRGGDSSVAELAASGRHDAGTRSGRRWSWSCWCRSCSSRGPAAGWLRDLGLLDRDEQFTELYFPDRRALPTTATVGSPIAFDVAVRNREGEATSYRWKAVVTVGGRDAGSGARPRPAGRR